MLRPHLPTTDQIYILSASGDSIRRITDDDKGFNTPVWSPDGKLLANQQYTERRRTKVDLITPKGKLVRRWDAGEQGVGAPPSFSPDGRLLAFPWTRWSKTRDAVVGDLSIVPVAGGPRRVVARRAVGPASWSPDGRNLLYERGDIIGSFYQGQPADWDRHDIWMAKTNGRGSHEVLRDVDGAPIYSPAGDRFLFFRGLWPEETVWTAGLDGSDQRRVGGTYRYALANWAPPGGIWALVSGRQHSRAFLFRPDGEREELPEAIRSGPMDWSRDGRRIAWAEGPKIKTIRPDGTGERVLVHFRGDGSCGQVSWAPGGRRLAIVCAQFEGDA